MPLILSSTEGGQEGRKAPALLPSCLLLLHPPMPLTQDNLRHGFKRWHIARHSPGVSTCATCPPTLHLPCHHCTTFHAQHATHLPACIPHTPCLHFCAHTPLHLLPASPPGWIHFKHPTLDHSNDSTCGKHLYPTLPAHLIISLTHSLAGFCTLHGSFTQPRPPRVLTMPTGEEEATSSLLAMSP